MDGLCRLILFLQQSSVEWASSLWMHVVQELDPEFKRTVGPLPHACTAVVMQGRVLSSGPADEPRLLPSLVAMLEYRIGHFGLTERCLREGTVTICASQCMAASPNALAQAKPSLCIKDARTQAPLQCLT